MHNSSMIKKMKKSEQIPLDRVLEGKKTVVIKKEWEEERNRLFTNMSILIGVCGMDLSPWKTTPNSNQFADFFYSLY